MILFFSKRIDHWRFWRYLCCCFYFFFWNILFGYIWRSILFFFSRYHLLWRSIIASCLPPVFYRLYVRSMECLVARIPYSHIKSCGDIKIPYDFRCWRYFYKTYFCRITPSLSTPNWWTKQYLTSKRVSLIIRNEDKSFWFSQESIFF